MGPPAYLRREPFVRPANRLWQWFLTRYGFWAIPMPWRVVHVRRDIFPREDLMVWLVQHERVHYEQMERDGLLRWHFWYFWYTWKFGYRMNPYERMAYNRYGAHLYPEPALGHRR